MCIRDSPSEDGPEFSLADMSAVLATTYRLTIRVPGSRAPDGTDLLPAMRKGQDLLSEWMKGDDAFVIRIRPETPEVWSDKQIKQIMETLHADARAHDVILLIEHADARAHRKNIKRPAKATKA